MNDVDRVVQLSSEIVNLRAQLNRKEEELRKLIGGPDDGPLGVVRIREGSLSDLAFSVMRKFPGQSWCANDIHLIIKQDYKPEVGIQAVRVALTRLCNRLVVSRVRRGEYRLIESESTALVNM